jgi:hypothetical protein
MIHIDTNFPMAKIARMFGNTLKGPLFAMVGILFVLSTLNGRAGSVSLADSKDAPSVEIVPQAPTVEIVRESRGLVTSEGPSGMFMNPTTATLPQGAFAFAYCSVLTNHDTNILGNHMFLSYGVRDWLELGVVATMINVTIPGQELPEGDYATAGPMVRVRLRRDVNAWPEVSVGAYAKMGTDALDSKNVFIGASKTLPIDEKGFLKTVTFQGGFRETWLEAPDRNTNRFYGGVEVQLPCNLYLVGEVTQFARRKDDFTPWAAGIQWRGKRVGLTAAIVQSGDDNPPSIYLGIGGGLGAEPVRTSGQPPGRP